MSALTRSEVRVLALDPVGLPVPGTCACCGAAAASSRVERRPSDGRALIVPYCDGCQRHASRVTTHLLAASLSSLLLAGTLVLLLPLLWEGSPVSAVMLLACAGASFPLVLLGLWRRRSRPGHTSAGRAVWWSSRGELVCTSSRWAAELGSAANADLRIARERERWLTPWALAGPIAALVAAPAVHRFHHPLVRVLNLTETRIELHVDGRRIASVEPTSAESPAAGIELRIASGERDLTALSADGRVVAEAHVEVQSGEKHLYAPASESHCFWLERTRYGRVGASGQELTPLSGTQRFWTLPRDLDTWFSPNPEASEADRRSSGGELLALRQAPCVEAPPEVLGRAR